VPVLEKPVGNVVMANNNLGTPSLEEAIYRGLEGARQVLSRLK